MISPDTFIALSLFAVATSITPGPNNIMLLASGVNFGWRKTLPHTLGISTGLFVLLMSVGLGLGFLFTAFEPLQLALKVLGSAYMLYLAFRIATSRSIQTQADQRQTAQKPAEKKSRPMTFLEAALFQWVNPKAWVMAISGMSLYTNPANPYGSTLAVAVLFSLWNWPSCSTWAVFGRVLRGFLSDPKQRKRFNLVMGLLLTASVVLLLK